MMMSIYCNCLTFLTTTQYFSPCPLLSVYNYHVFSFLLFLVHNRCTAAEQKMNIPDGVLKKDNKSHDEKTKDLEADIKKKLKQLESMHVSLTGHYSIHKRACLLLGHSSFYTHHK